MSHLVYVDLSNLFIESQKVSAVARGMARSLHAANRLRVLDFDYRLDLYRLMEMLSRPGRPGAAVAFGSVTDTNEAIWRHATNAGFETVTVERGHGGKEKRVDTSVVTRMCRDAYLLGHPRRDWITLVAGDGDYVPTVRQIVADGYSVGVAYWGHASRELREAATRFVPLDPYLADLEVERENATSPVRDRPLHRGVRPSSVRASGR